MSAYKCVKCSQEIDVEIDGRIRCMHCGYRILSKKRLSNPKRVDAV